jgi:hypothetical protein
MGSINFTKMTQTMEKHKDFDFDVFRQTALKELYDGKPLMGDGGIFTPLLKHFLEAGLQGEMDNHLREERTKSAANRRNGLSKKEVRSNMGKFELETPRDRSGSYEPTIVPKRQTILTEQLEEKIISMYGRGMTGPPVRLSRYCRTSTRIIWFYTFHRRIKQHHRPYFASY